MIKDRSGRIKGPAGNNLRSYAAAVLAVLMVLTAAAVFMMPELPAYADGDAASDQAPAGKEVSEPEAGAAESTADVRPNGDAASGGVLAESIQDAPDNAGTDDKAEGRVAEKIEDWLREIWYGRDFNTDPAMIQIGDPDAVPPELEAEGAALYSIDLGRVLYSLNGDARLNPYSITKLLTCYLALERLDPDEVVTISADATRVYENGTSIFLKTGERISVKDLVYGALLASGNDAAYALGEAVSGSEKDFARLMNAEAESWGCSGTHFVNANGWKDPEHYTTAMDMCIIAAHCLGNETLASMSGTDEYTIPATNMTGERRLVNYMRYSSKKVPGVYAGKTGTWTDDDCSIVLGFRRDELDGIIVLLGDTRKSREKDAAALAEFLPVVTPGFIVSNEGDIAAAAKVRHGAETMIPLAVDGGTLAYPSSGMADDIRVETEPAVLEAPVSKGDAAGICRIYVDGDLIAEHGLTAACDVETGWLPSYWYISNRQTIIICCGAASLIVIIAVIRAAASRRLKTGRGYDPKH